MKSSGPREHGTSGVQKRVENVGVVSVMDEIMIRRCEIGREQFRSCGAAKR